MKMPGMKLAPALALLSAAQPALARSGDGSGGLVIGGIVAAGAAYFFFKSQVDKGIEAGIAKRKSEIEAESARRVEEAKRREEEERFKTTRHAEELERRIAQRKCEVVAAMAAFKTDFIHGRMWLAEFIAEAFAAPEQAAARALENKKHPAQKAADEVRRVSAEKKDLRSRLKQLEYAIKTYHEYYPVLEEYSDDILNEAASLDLDDDEAADADRVAKFISREEYARLSVSERNQLALDKWKARGKSNVEIGRIYERYLGYLYEKDGWAVSFIGALEGLEDMGRDLLCVRDGEVHVVQAKCWSKRKVIHEKHIFQLYGTTVLLPLTHRDLAAKSISPIFATTTALSDTAQWAAKALKVRVKPIDMDHDYPVIKCNVNGSNRIYHLPFDQQYDRVRIIPSKGELYARTVAEAEKSGFRRAKKHYG